MAAARGGDDDHDDDDDHGGDDDDDDDDRATVAAGAEAATTMTDGRTSTTTRRRRSCPRFQASSRSASRSRSPGRFRVIAGSAGLFFAIAALLAFQMRAGADPALGKGEPVVVAQATPAPRRCWSGA